MVFDGNSAITGGMAGGGAAGFLAQEADRGSLPFLGMSAAPIPNCTSDGNEVELAFSNPQLRAICERRRTAIAAIGVHGARELEQRLADIVALATVADLAELLPDDIIERSPVERSIRLKVGYDLVFCAGHVKVPSTPAGATDWAQVSRIKITALEATRG